MLVGMALCSALIDGWAASEEDRMHTAAAVGAHAASLLLVCAVEASTSQIDNLVLPPLLFALAGLTKAVGRNNSSW